MKQVTPEISKCRLSIFYAGKNRNGTYITEKFAEKLLSSLPYTPVVGIFDNEKDDFQGHSYDPEEAQIYGVVPENPNFSWEDSLDEDGQTRKYATTDVYLFTGRLSKAKRIVGKKHSMELDPDSISGEWKLIDGEYFFSYTQGAFLGLSVLGEDFTPCFEGSKFFELVTKFNSFMENKMGGKQMTDEKKDLENLESPEQEVTEEVNNSQETVEEPEVQENPETQETEEVEETTEDSTDGEVEEVVEENYSLTKEQFECFEQVEKTIGSINTVVSAFETLQSQLSEANSKILEYSSQIDTLKTELDSVNEKYSQLEELYQAEQNKKKESLCEKYSAFVPEESLNKIKESINNFSLEDLEKELLFAGRDTLLKNESAIIPSSFDTNDCEDAVEAELRRIQERRN